MKMGPSEGSLDLPLFIIAEQLLRVNPHWAQ